MSDFIPDFEQFFFEVLTDRLPGFTVKADLDNTELTYSDFPVVFFSVSTTESELSENSWDDEGVDGFTAILSLNLLSTPRTLGPNAQTVTRIVKGLRYTRFDLEVVPQYIISVLRVRAQQLFSSTGQSSLAGGKQIAQAASSFELEMKGS